METISLQISKEIVNPIVETKIKEAILAALGGSDLIVKKVIDEVLNRKVDASGKISTYSHDNKYSWLDAVVTDQIKKAVEEELKAIIKESSSRIKDELIKQLQTKKGSSKAAEALLSAMNGTFGNSWSSKFNIEFNSSRD